MSMKKSEIYHIAALCVLNDTDTGDNTKLEMLSELMERERLERLFEEQAAKKEAETK
jgi:hypothetical protein